MKKNLFGILLAFLLAMLTTAPSAAQVRFGVRGGANIMTMHFNNDLLKADNLTGFQIGPMLEAMVPFAGIGVDAAILYSQKGMELDGNSVKTDYIDVPVNLKWKFGLPIVKAYLAAGPYIGFRVGGDKIWNVLEDQIEAKSFSAGLNFGAGVELVRHLQVGFNYGLGLTDNYSAQLLDLNAKNRGWSITAAILF